MTTISNREQMTLAAALERHGLRTTRHREHIFKVLRAHGDHPTADEVFARAKEGMPAISMATVYNCLETLVTCDLIKRLNYEREPTRFCSGGGEHAHFFDESSGSVFDIDMPDGFERDLTAILPKGFRAHKVKLSFSGRIDDREHRVGPMSAAHSTAGSGQ